MILDEALPCMPGYAEDYGILECSTDADAGVVVCYDPRTGVAYTRPASGDGSLLLTYDACLGYLVLGFTVTGALAWLALGGGDEE